VIRDRSLYTNIYLYNTFCHNFIYLFCFVDDVYDDIGGEMKHSLGI